MRPTLKNWSFDGIGLRGAVYNYPDKEEGKYIATSNLLEMRRDGDELIAVCASREYLLEDVDPGYERAYPNIVERMLKQFEHKLN